MYLIKRCVSNIDIVDIALIHLVGSDTFNMGPGIDIGFITVNFDIPNEQLTGRLLTVSGWGTNGEPFNTGVPDLMQATQDIVDTDGDLYSEKRVLQASQRPSGAAACVGDGGGTKKNCCISSIL